MLMMMMMHPVYIGAPDHWSIRGRGRGYLPAVGQEVHLDVEASGSAVGSQGELHGLQHVDDQLVARFVIPQLHLEDGTHADVWRHTRVYARTHTMLVFHQQAVLI